MKAAKSREADGILMNDLVAAFYMKQLNETSFYVAYRLQAQDLTIVERKRNTTSWLRDLKTCYEEKLDYDHGISQSFIEFEAKYPVRQKLLMCNYSEGMNEVHCVADAVVTGMFS